MDAQTFNFELISPEEKVMAGPARMVVIPGEEGDFGVLPQHSALVSAIRPGVIEVFGDEGTAPRRIFVAGGFADVTPTGCTVLAEEAADVASLDRGALEQTIRDLREDIALASGEAERERAARKLALAQARLAAAGG